MNSLGHAAAQHQMYTLYRSAALENNKSIEQKAALIQFRH